MPLLFIHAMNAEFDARDEGTDYDRPEAALECAVRGALALATDEIVRGERSVAVEVSIEREDGTSVLRSVVNVSVSPLMSSEQAAAQP